MGMNDRGPDVKAEVPSVDELLPLPIVDAPHPSVWAVDELVSKCEIRTQSRSGPGGQHRNRTASGVFITYRPAEITAEATEERNQHRNRSVAVQRLRMVLAVSLRTPSMLLPPPVALDELERVVRERYHRGSLKLNETNEDKPALMALLLNDLHASGGQPSLVGPVWGVSTSRIVTCLKSHPPAMLLVNRIRSHHGRGPLK